MHWRGLLDHFSLQNRFILLYLIGFDIVDFIIMLVLAIKNQRIFVITYLPTTPGRLYVVMMLILETQEKELKHPRSLRIKVRHVT